MSDIDFSQKTVVPDESFLTEECSSGDESSASSKRTYGEIGNKDHEVAFALNTSRPYVQSHEMLNWFKNMQQKEDGKMTAIELQQAFELFQGRYFSDSSCKFVVRLFDLDQNGGLDIKEFEILYYYVKQWVNAFHTYDKERTGALDENQLNDALKHMDIHFSSEFIKYLITRNNPIATKMSLDQYIVTCIQIQRYTDEFKRRDKEYTGHINVKYEDFLELVMRCL